MSDAADQRVSELLADLERNAAPPPGNLSDRVVRTARWQHAVRNSLVISSELATVVGVALRLTVGARKP